MLAPALVLLGEVQWMPVRGAGQLAFYPAGILFVANVFVSVGRARAGATRRPGAGVRPWRAVVAADAG
jgi:hypothetical protein